MESPSSPPPAKRVRTDSNVNDSKRWKRHPDLYMPDGTLVLLTKDTLFRVYPGLLSKHSEVFSGMASLSECQPPNAEAYDGCPLVRLTDNTTDLAHFLKMTMGLYHFHVDQPTSLCAAAILRLSAKYMVAPLRQQAIEHFSYVIPQGFDEIITRKDYKQVFGDNPPHPFELVSLFRECQLTRFLPWAFYTACKQGFNELISGGVSYGGQGKVINMAEADTRIALQGWQKLCDETREIRRATIMSHALNCESGHCNDTLRVNWLNFAFHDDDVNSNSFERWDRFWLINPRFKTTNDKPHKILQSPCLMCVE